MNRFFMTTFAVLSAGLAHAAVSGGHAPVTNATPACTTSPCANTADAQSRGDMLEREGKNVLDKIRQSADDRTRWKTVLYSEGTSTSELELTIVKSADFKMRLDPKAGTLSFSTATSLDTFAIHDRRSRVDPCPSYNIRIVEASPAHALIRHVCPKKEYQPGKFYMSNQYFLYDVETGTATSIWLAAASGKETPFPSARPHPTVQPIRGGYMVKWAGDFPGDSPSGKIELRNKYMPQSVSGKRSLVCIDVSDPGAPAVENGMCEGEALEKLASHGAGTGAQGKEG